MKYSLFVNEYEEDNSDLLLTQEALSLIERKEPDFVRRIASVFSQCVYKRMSAGFHGIRSESVDGDQNYFFIHM